MKPKRSLFNYVKNDTFSTKIQPTIDPAKINVVDENDIFESPRSEEAPSLSLSDFPSEILGFS